MGFFVIIGILILSIVVSIVEIPRLRKQNQKKELWVFSFLLLLAVGMGVSVTLHVNLPNPFDTITAIYKPLNDVIQSVLQ